MSRQSRLWTALALNGGIAAVEIVGALNAHSSALFSDAGHNLADVASVGLALFALHLSFRGATASKSFGYHRATILSALANIALLFSLTALIAANAIARLLHPSAVHGGTVAIVGAAALVANSVGALLMAERGGGLQMQSLLLHLGGDAVASLGVLITGVIIAQTGHFESLDPIVSLFIAALIVAEGVHVARGGIAILLEASPADIDLVDLATAISSVPGVASVHDLHCWSLSSDVRALSAHIVLDSHPSLEEAQIVGAAIKASIAVPFGIAHTTLELECEPCEDDGALVCTIEPVVRLATSRSS
jgi:cobalt-zinc-cadmium efflux system protein